MDLIQAIVVLQRDLRNSEVFLESGMCRDVEFQKDKIEAIKTVTGFVIEVLSISQNVGD